MPGHISNQRDEDKELTTITVTGEVVFSQVNEQILTFLSGTPTRFVLWDLRGGTVGHLSADDMRRLVTNGAPLAHKRSGGRTAILVDNTLDHGLARMFGIFAELYHIPFAISVFRDHAAAMDWLLTEPSA
jgi:hypothetical protein